MSVFHILFPFDGVLEEPWVHLPGVKLALDSSSLKKVFDEMGSVVFAPSSSGFILLSSSEGEAQRAVHWRGDFCAGEERQDFSCPEPLGGNSEDHAIIRFTGKWGELMDRVLRCLTEGDSFIKGVSAALQEMERGIGHEILIEPILARTRVKEFLEKMSKGISWVVPRDGVSFLRLDRAGEGWTALAILLHEGRLVEAWTDKKDGGTHQEYVCELKNKGRSVSLGVTADLGWVERKASTCGLSDLLVEAYKDKGLLLDPVSPGLRMALGALRVASLFGLFDGEGR